MAEAARKDDATHDYPARAAITINAPPGKVWQALTDPALLRDVMFGSEVVTDWTIGSAITWRGEWQGRPFEDKGKVLAFEPERVLSMTHFSPLAGKPDAPENYHEVTYRLTPEGEGRTRVECTQTNNPTAESAGHAEANWKMMLDNLRKIAER